MGVQILHAIVSFFSKCSRNEAADERRFVEVNVGRIENEFCDNEVKTTKYNILSFLPINIFNQLKRPINAYFIVVAALQFIPGVAPVSPYSTIFPITIAFGTNALKEAIDDIKRYRQDAERNSRKCRRVNWDTHTVEEVMSRDIRVGDVLVLKSDDAVPCDVVALVSSECENGTVYISTETLDGETGWKERYSILKHANINTTDHADGNGVEEQQIMESARLIFESNISFEIDGPNGQLGSFSGCVEFSNDSVVERGYGLSATNGRESLEQFVNSAEGNSHFREIANYGSNVIGGEGSGTGFSRKATTMENVILSSSVIRYTPYLLCVAVYTGMETKVNMTHSSNPSKAATIDDTINNVAIAIFVLQLAIVIIFTFLSQVTLVSNHFWYLGRESEVTSNVELFVVLPLRYFTMLSPMVPLSFKTMMEISKVYISGVISWDMSISEDGKGATVNNSSLAEDLGQVEYLITDKTGTLTQNEMLFKIVTIANPETTFEKGINDMREVGRLAQRSESAYHLLMGMVFCNTIKNRLVDGEKVETSFSQESNSCENEDDVWVSTSPDEVALVKGAKWCGMTLKKRSKTTGEAEIAGTLEKVSIIHVFPFSSERGRMSVLLQYEKSGKCILLTKGSDESVLPLCELGCRGTEERNNVDDQRELGKSNILRPLSSFSGRGLRTLVFAYRPLTSENLADFSHCLREIQLKNIDQERKKSLMNELQDRLETSLTYCGCTAVEDKLQCNVKETIDRFRNADIKVWMLTGDKMETARQTAIASGILLPTDRVFDLTPPNDNVIRSDSENLRIIESTIENILNSTDVSQIPPTSRLRRWYVSSGLLSFFQEFLLGFKYDLLKPISHYLKKDFLLSNGTDLRNTNIMETNEFPSTVSTIPNSTYYNSREISQFLHLTSLANNEGTRGTTTIFCSGKVISLIESSRNEKLYKDFSRAMLSATTVICSRTAPNQKSMIVQIAKDSRKVTLAVGDGGNDVAMIQTAQVGVGIKGKEGNQASSAADFAVSQFQFLSTLIFVHGHSAYNRTAIIVQQSFWKTVLIAWVQVLYNLYTDYSAVSFWDSFSMLLYNAIPTVPVTFLCVMDVPLSPWMLLNNPRLYKMSQKGRYLNTATFYGYILRALLHGTVIFYLAKCIHIGGGATLPGGWMLDRDGDFYAAYFAVVTVHTYTVLTESHSVNFAQWTCFAFSVASCFWCFGTSAMIESNNQTFLVLLRSPSFYLEYLVLLGTVCLSLALYASVKVTWFPDLLQFQRTVALNVHQNYKPKSLFGQLFPDNNKSMFWQSLTPIHALCPSPYSLGEELSSGEDYGDRESVLSNASPHITSSVRIRNLT